MEEKALHVVKYERDKHSKMIEKYVGINPVNNTCNIIISYIDYYLCFPNHYCFIVLDSENNLHGFMLHEVTEDTKEREIQIKIGKIGKFPEWMFDCKYYDITIDMFVFKEKESGGLVNMSKAFDLLILNSEKPLREHNNVFITTCIKHEAMSSLRQMIFMQSREFVYNPENNVYEKYLHIIKPY